MGPWAAAAASWLSAIKVEDPGVSCSRCQVITPCGYQLPTRRCCVLPRGCRLHLAALLRLYRGSILHPTEAGRRLSHRLQGWARWDSKESYLPVSCRCKPALLRANYDLANGSTVSMLYTGLLYWNSEMHNHLSSSSSPQSSECRK